MNRVIPLGRRSLTGYIPSRLGAELLAYESRLERDALVLLQLEPKLIELRTQPFSIEYISNGKRRRYTPDILATWHLNADSPYGFKTMIFEVKPASALKKGDSQALKFDAIRSYATQNGLGFAILTEHEIRIPRLKNAESLVPHWTRQPDDLLWRTIEKIVRLGPQPATVENVINKTVQLGWSRNAADSAVKCLIARQILSVDFDQPIGPATKVKYWLDEGPAEDVEDESSSRANS